MTELPQFCDRAGCHKPMTTWCPICVRCFCLEHDKLPDGHVCLSAMKFNVSHQLEPDEVDQALEHFRPVP